MIHISASCDYDEISLGDYKNGGHWTQDGFPGIYGSLFDMGNFDNHTHSRVILHLAPKDDRYRVKRDSPLGQGLID